MTREYRKEIKDGRDSMVIMGHHGHHPTISVDGILIARNPEEICKAIYTAAGLAWPPVIPDPLDPVRTSLRELANDPGLCTTERTRAQRALDALS